MANLVFLVGIAIAREDNKLKISRKVFVKMAILRKIDDKVRQMYQES